MHRFKGYESSQYGNAEFMLTFRSYKRGLVIDQKYLFDEIDCTVVSIDYMPTNLYRKDFKKMNF